MRSQKTSLAVEAPASSKTQNAQRRLVSDTVFRCALAVVQIRLGKRLIRNGARTLSEAHPARVTYETTIGVLSDRMSVMPWRGCVPAARLISTTQTLWLIVVILLVNLIFRMFCLPHIPMFLDAAGVPKIHLSIE